MDSYWTLCSPHNRHLRQQVQPTPPMVQRQKSKESLVPGRIYHSDFQPRYADPESADKLLSCWFAFYFPAPCLMVLHGFRRLTLPTVAKVFSEQTVRWPGSNHDLMRDRSTASCHSSQYLFSSYRLTPFRGFCFRSQLIPFQLN